MTDPRSNMTDPRIEKIREKFLEIDRSIVILLVRRFQMVGELGKLKAELGLPVEDKAREAELHAIYENIAREEGADPALVKAVLQSIIAQSKKHQA